MTGRKSALDPSQPAASLPTIVLSTLDIIYRLNHGPLKHVSQSVVLVVRFKFHALNHLRDSERVIARPQQAVTIAEQVILPLCAVA